MRNDRYKWLVVILGAAFSAGCAVHTEPAPSTPPPASVSEKLSAHRNLPPVYPPEAKSAGQQGKVVLRVLVGADGKASQTQIFTSSGHQLLDDAALKAVSSWRFVPGQRNGVAEAMWSLIPITFALN